MASAYMTPTAQAQRTAEMDETVSIRVNGAHRRVPAGISVADLALELGLEPTKVAVERNLEIVPRSTLARVRVEDGDDFEIVTFVGGG
jgi:thiamine biosynthesis protein ThiS